MIDTISIIHIDTGRSGGGGRCALVKCCQSKRVRNPYFPLNTLGTHPLHLYHHRILAPNTSLTPCQEPDQVPHYLNHAPHSTPLPPLQRRQLFQEAGGRQRIRQPWTDLSSAEWVYLWREGESREHDFELWSGRKRCWGRKDRWAVNRGR